MTTNQRTQITRDLQFHKFRAYGLLKNLRFFDPFLVLFFREAGLSFLAIGALISIREIFTNVLEIPTGVLADAFGRRKAMLWGFASYLGSFVLFFVGSHYAVYVLAMIAFAFGETFRSGTHKAMILEHLRSTGCEDLKVLYYGKTRAASQFGSALASLIAAALVLWTGHYKIVFLASTIPYLLNFLLLASYPRSLDGTHVSQTRIDWRTMGTQFAAAIRGLWMLVRDRHTMRGLLSGAGFDALFKTTKDYLQPIVQAQALALPILLAFRGEQRTAILVGFVYFLIYLATSVASSHAGAVQRHLKSQAFCLNVSLVLGAILLIGAGISAWLHWDAVAIAAFVGLYILQNLRRPMIVGYLADRIDHRSMASGLSVEVQLRTLLMAAMAPALGWMADHAGIGIGIAILSGFSLLCLPLVMTHDAPSD